MSVRVRGLRQLLARRRGAEALCHRITHVVSEGAQHFEYAQLLKYAAVHRSEPAHKAYACNGRSADCGVGLG
eukprot:1454975-Pleurochrysis_carterae.AAC.1